MNRKNWKKIMLVSIVLLAVVISGFSAMAHAAAPQKETRAGGVLKIAMQQDLPNFNYFDLTSNTVWKSNVIGWNYESLIGMDFDGKPYGLLAKDWDFNPNSNPITITLHLRHGVTFQDGQPFTANDVIFSFCALRKGTTVSGTSFTIPFDDNNDGTVSFSEIQNHVKYVDDYTVKITARQPYNYFFLGTLGLPIIPEHIWKDHLVDSGDGQGTQVLSHGYTHGIVDTTWNNDPAATIGTGAWMYAGGVKDSYRLEKPYSGYWGKDFKTPDGYSLWSQNVSEMDFKVYSNLDTAVLALQTGDVDYIAWSIQPGKVPILKQDPNINLHYMADNGYFYLAFDQKQYPANYIAFRHAVSHVIDKATAVQRYLGGFGRAGDSVEPPFFTSWYNASVQHYPYSPATAKKILDGEHVSADNGFVEQDPAWNEKFTDVNGDGWRDLPDGSPMQPITLFTPPADYDPVRIKVGQGIAQNLRSLGVNIQAKPVDFDTLVAYMQSYNYVMLELGWSLSTDAIGNLADIFGPQSIQNTWGWWNSSNPNPYYVNSGGVQNTRADKFSQSYATLFSKVINKAATTFDTNTQIKYTKWAQNIIAQATVVNVLYYRLNIEATRKSWNGWIEWQGSVFNGFSLASLTKGSIGGGSGPNPGPGVGPGPIPGLNKTMDVSLSVPGKVVIGNKSSSQGSVYVLGNNGLPLAGAHVSVTTNNKILSVSPANGTTNSKGMFTFSISGVSEGMTYLNVSVSAQGYPTVNRTATVGAVYSVPHILSATITAQKMSLTPGSTTSIMVHVVDQNGNAVSGASVSVDQNLLGYGTLDKYNGTTDAKGDLSFTYTAPSASQMSSAYINMHTIGKVVVTVSKDGYDTANTPMLQLLTYNKNPSTWDVVRVASVTNWTVNATSLTTDITLNAVGIDGTPLKNTLIDISYSNVTYIASPPKNVTTDANGVAHLKLTFNNGLLTKVVVINFDIPSVHSIGDAVDILYWNGSVGVPLYGGHISIDPFMVGDTSLNYTVELYNQTNQHPIGNQTIGTVLGDSPDKALADLASGPAFDTAWEYVGINVYADYSDTTLGLPGEWNGIADDTNTTVNWLDWGFDAHAAWGVPNQETTAYYLSVFYGMDMEPMQIVNGTGTFTLARAQSTYRDLTENLYVITGGLTYYITDPSVNAFVMYGNQSFNTQVGFQRAMKILVENVNIDSMVTPGSNFTVTATVYNQDNTPVSGVTVKAYNNAIASKAKYPAAAAKTDSNGVAKITPTAPEISTVSEVAVYVKAVGDSTTYSVLQGTQIAIVPPYMFMDVTPDSNGVMVGEKVTFDVFVHDINGNGIPGVTVSTSTSMSNVTITSAVTNSTGHATFVLDTSDINPAVDMNGYTLTNIPVTVSAVKAGYSPVTSATGVVITKGYAPMLAVGLADNAEIISGTYNLSGYVYSLTSIEYVRIIIDKNAPVNATVKKVAGTAAMNKYEWSYSTNLGEGKHVITVYTVDANGMYNAQILNVTAKALSTSGGGGGGSTPGTGNGTTSNPGGGVVMVGGVDLWLIITILLVIIVIVMGAMMGKKNKGAAPAEEPAEEPEEEEPAEEPEEEESEEEENPEEGGEEL